MKRGLLVIALIALVFSCKEEKKATEPTIAETEEKVDEKTTVKLPEDIVQLNEEEFVGDGITLTKVQVQDAKDDNFVYKVFFETDNIDTYKNGDYALFVQNFAYQDDIPGLEEKFQKSGVASYWVNLKSAQPYQDGYVVFRTFNSKLYTFQKTVVGVMNLKTKTDVFRTQYDDSFITN